LERRPGQSGSLEMMMFSIERSLDPQLMFFTNIFCCSQWRCILPGKRDARQKMMAEKLETVAQEIQLISRARRGIG
jgi:hypothetical protein